MCGIAGYVTSSTSFNPQATAQVFLDSLRHRGPDENGVLLSPRFGLCNTRLSILDIAHGRQPFYSSDRQIAVIQNGEIYNFLEVKADLERAGIRFDTHCDTEVILRAYETYGPEFITKLNGMFAIAIVDERKGSLFLYRDRLGVKPLYLCRTAKSLYFASEIKSFRGLPDFSAEINETAVYLYLVYNYVPLPQTIFRNVEHVVPGTRVTIDLNTLKTTAQVYWSIVDQPEDIPSDHASIVDTLDDIFRDAVKIRLRSDVPIGVFLSSGLDSGLVAAGVSRIDPAARDAYTVRFRSPEFDESELAAETARAFGWRTHPVDVELDDLTAWPGALVSADQPHGDISFVALKKLSCAAAKDLKVVYTGDGGDEALAGYDRYLRLFRSTGPQDELLRTFFAEESVFEEDTLLRKSCTPDFLRRAAHPGAAFDLFRETIGEVSAKDIINRVLYMDMRQLLPGTNLVKVDRMTMAHSLEARSPFLDYRFYDYLFRVPGARKLLGNQIRALERELAERYLPKSTIYRPKKMLAVPIGDWFRNKLKEPLMNYFEHEFRWDRGYFQPAAIQSLVQSHISGTGDYRRPIRALIALDIWFRELEGRPMPELIGTQHAR